jgi:hypothetical protein
MGHVSDANHDGRGGASPYRVSHPRNGAARNSRLATLTDSLELVAPGGFRREDRPGLPLF